MNARELCERYLRCVTERDLDAFAALFAEDATFEQPFAMPGRPSRRQGRDVLRAATREGWSRSPVHFEEVCNLVVQEASQEDAAFAELEFRGTNRATGASFRLPMALSLRACDGQITSLREYFNPFDGAKIVGATEAVAVQLLASLREPEKGKV
jgi:ketosteroid isomerase-like protein